MCDVVYTSKEQGSVSVDVDMGLVEDSDNEGGEMRRMWYHFEVPAASA